MADGDQRKLLEQVERTSAYFSSIVELIPTKYCLPDTQNDQSKSSETVVGKLPREKKKELVKKAKLQKLDPSKHKTVGEMQKEVEERDLGVSDENGEPEIGNIKPMDLTKVSSLPLDDLRKKLHDKIELLRGKRKLKDEQSGESKAKKKKTEKSAKKNKKQNKDFKNSEITKSSVQNERKMTQVLNDRGEVVFSKFDFAEESSKRKKKAKKNDLNALLKKAEKRKENLEKLEEESKEKAEELKSKIKWDKALKLAEGVKVKDDPKLLQKSIKRKLKIKDASKRKWEDRVNTQKKHQEEKQKLRKQHLQERKEKKGTKGGKTKKQNKKGRKHKPGF